MNSEEYKFSNERCVQLFYSKSKTLKELSNFYPQEIEVKGKRFPNGEVCFHYFKFMHLASETSGECRKALEEQAEKIMLAETPRDAKKLGGKKSFSLTEDQQWSWQKQASAVQHLICDAKLNSASVRKALIDTGTDYLLHQGNRANETSRWDGRIKCGTLIGHNELGKIWMEKRSKLMNEDDEFIIDSDEESDPEPEPVKEPVVEDEDDCEDEGDKCPAVCAEDEEFVLDDEESPEKEYVTAEEFIKGGEKKKKATKRTAVVKPLKQKEIKARKNQVLINFNPIKDGFSTKYDARKMQKMFGDEKDERLMACMMYRHTLGCKFDPSTEQALNKIENKVEYDSE